MHTYSVRILYLDMLGICTVFEEEYDTVLCAHAITSEEYKQYGEMLIRMRKLVSRVLIW